MSETCSIRSSSTSSSSRYRTISRSSSIDESLFGENRRPIRQSTKKLEDAGINCINKADILKITRRSSQHNGESSKSLLQKNADAVKKKAKARRDYMLRLEMEKSEKEKATKTKQKTKLVIDVKKEQNEDIVKLLHTCKQRTAAFDIRDQQLKDKSIREKEERDYERLMDLEMEVNRLKDIAERKKEDDAKIKKRIADRKVIEDQIKERQHLRLLQEEARDQENRKMLDTIKKYKEEDTAKAKKRKEEARRVKIEMIKRNEEMLAEREQRKLLEKQEEEMIVAYLAERDEKLLQREQEEADAQKKMIELQKKLLESQSKILDKRSEMDELRARRAAEEHERKHRQRELEEAQKRKRNMDVLHRSRKQQEQEKAKEHQREKREKQAEYNDAIGHAFEMAKRERHESEVAKKKNAELIKMLQQQIEEKESKTKLQEQEKYKEGKAIKEKMAAERDKLESIRTMMVEDMRAKGVNEKYFGEVLTLDIEKILTQ